jgi:hypothetical protein
MTRKRPIARPLCRTTLTLCTLALALLAPRPARAADVLEPWSEGLSNVELFTTFGDGFEAGETTAAVGMGLPRGFSLGLTLASAEGEPTQAGFVVVWTRSLGALGELDLWGEYVPVGQEVELMGADRSVGVEWSGSARRSVPYVRLSLSDDAEGRHFHPLVGWMLPVGDRLELHVELSSEEPASGAWPLHLAIGPNWSFGDALELLPELSAIYDPQGGDGHGETSFFFTLGIVLDPGLARGGVVRN